MWSRKNGAGIAGGHFPGLENIQTLIRESEAVLKATADQGNDVLQEARVRLEKSLRATRESIGEIDTDEVAKRARRAVRVADKYVRGQPWPVILGGVVIGLLIGVAVVRSKSAED